MNPTVRPCQIAAELSVDQAVVWMQQVAETYRVVVEHRQTMWRVDIEGVAVINVSRLAEVTPQAHDVISRLYKGVLKTGVRLTLQVSLPESGRLDLTLQYRAEAEQPGSEAYRNSALRASEAALCGAARELAAMGVAVDDIAGLLAVTEQRVHELVHG